MKDRKTSLLEYIVSRGIKDQWYLDLLSHGSLNKSEFRLCNVDRYDFLISHFFNESDDVGYGLISSNQNLHTDNGTQVAIGLVEGDDVICFDTRDGSINLWLIENGNGEHLNVAPDFASFWRMIT